MNTKSVLVAGGVFAVAGAAAWFAADLWSAEPAAASPHASAEAVYPAALAQLLGRSTQGRSVEPDADEHDLSAPAPPDPAALAPVEDPRLTVTLPAGKRALEFGEVRHGTGKVALLRVTNTGSRPLTISGTTCACACLEVAEAETRLPIEPGEARELSVKFWANSGAAGKHRKNLVLLCNDPKQPRVRVPIVADVQLALRVVEPTLVFDVAPDGTGTTKVHVVGLPGEDSGWVVSRIRGFALRSQPGLSDLEFDVEYSTGSARERTAALRVHHAGFEKPGKYVLPLVIQTDHAEQPHLLVQTVFDKNP
jgi:hypothetical protein